MYVFQIISYCLLLSKSHATFIQYNLHFGIGINYLYFLCIFKGSMKVRQLILAPLFMGVPEVML